MEKKIKEHIVDLIPDFISNAIDYVKINFEENGQKILETAGGTVSIVSKLLGQPLLDKYFKKVEENKLKDFGFSSYLKAAIKQANSSLEEINYALEKIDWKPKKIFDVIKDSLATQSNNFTREQVLLIFQPKYHPAVLTVKEAYSSVLRKMQISISDEKVFITHFNKNVEASIIEEFGSSYEKHLKETEKFRLQDNETEFLYDITLLDRIGFKEHENLNYEKTYGTWEKVSNLIPEEEEEEEGEEHIKIEETEKSLIPIENLIEEYFNNEPHNHLEKILFIIADFGKGKSVFLKQYASQLAKSYLENHEGYFPVYFNLRNFKHYQIDTKLGIISDYLLTKYGIKINDDYFCKKRFVFLIDSLDEAGELSKHSVDQVISSIKSIQNIDKQRYRTNKIIITSRPFEEGLKPHLKNHKPHVIQTKDGKEIEYFISIYGFKKDQFNNWLYNSLLSNVDLYRIVTSGFAKNIVDAVRAGEKIDIYNQLIKDKTLQASELRRPIFVYMIYQLIINNIDFYSVGKIGVYLSFLNFLTKDAKYIDDPNYKVNLSEEFSFRNILHATGALWMYQRLSGKTGVLKKADVCRAIEGSIIDSDDERVLSKYRGSDVSEVQFLSHSYFGESDNVLHFHHQSFAEILVAEYYLKVFINYALDEKPTSEVRTRLVLGEPTLQTIAFLSEMLVLLRDTVTNNPTQEILEKRKLLLPLLASIATRRNNERLFCFNLYHGWYKQYENKINEGGNKIPFEMLTNWFITEDVINKIIELSVNIIESTTTYLLTEADAKTALINHELIEIRNPVYNLPPDMDKWLALVVGNRLFNNVEKKGIFR